MEVRIPMQLVGSKSIALHVWKKPNSKMIFQLGKTPQLLSSRSEPLGGAWRPESPFGSHSMGGNPQAMCLAHRWQVQYAPWSNGHMFLAACCQGMFGLESFLPTNLGVVPVKPPKVKNF